MEISTDVSKHLGKEKSKLLLLLCFQQTKFILHHKNLHASSKL